MSELNQQRIRGIALYASQFGMSPAAVEAHFVENYGQDFAEAAFMTTGNGSWDENSLSDREKSLIVIAILATLGGVDERLVGHMKWAQDRNASIEDIRATLLLVANYAGFPRASVAMDLLKKITT